MRQWAMMGLVKVVQLPKALGDGDLVSLLAPASWSEEEWIATSVELLESWGLRVRLGRHVHDRVGYLAGSDADRLDDLNAALRDPEVRAIVTLRGGCGSARLLHGVDAEALKDDPKPLLGFSDITALHRVWHSAGVASLHGCLAGVHVDGVRDVLRGRAPTPLTSDPAQLGAELTTSGRAEGPLFGGNLEMLARSVGVLPFDLRGHVLLLEINRAAGLGMVDRALTQLLMAGALDGVVGVAVGWLQGFEEHVDRGWSIIDVLHERLAVLDVPVLAGLPLGHDPNPRLASLGVACQLDADSRTLGLSAALAPPEAPAERPT